MNGALGPVGYYVHHHGAGHAALALAVADVIPERIVGLGSGAPPPGWSAPWVHLPRDDVPPPVDDPTRDGAWHWAPRGHPGFQARMATIARWITDQHPSAIVVDVSCEVVAVAGLLGVPTVAIVMHGRRTDRAHVRAWDTADALVAPSPETFAEPWQSRWAAKTTHVGLTSRFDGRDAPVSPDDRTVTVLLPSGGHAVEGVDVEEAACATAEDGWRWQVLGGSRRVDSGGGGVLWRGPVTDPWPGIARSTVVVAACGRGSVADIAAARRPAVLIPQARPYDEQAVFAAHLSGRAPVAIRPVWPTGPSWPGLLEEVAALDPAGWDPLHDGRGARRLAAIVDEVMEV